MLENPLDNYIVKPFKWVKNDYIARKYSSNSVHQFWFRSNLLNPTSRVLSAPQHIRYQRGQLLLRSISLCAWLKPIVTILLLLDPNDHLWMPSLVLLLLRIPDPFTHPSPDMCWPMLLRSSLSSVLIFFCIQCPEGEKRCPKRPINNRPSPHHNCSPHYIHSHFLIIPSAAAICSKHKEYVRPMRSPFWL